MNVLNTLGAFTADASKGGDRMFTCNGEITMVVPTTHEGNTESFGGGTLALQYSTDGGDAWQTYTDTDSNAATLTAVNQTLRCFFAGPTKVRLDLSGSTSPDITCVNMTGEVYLPHLL